MILSDSQKLVVREAQLEITRAQCALIQAQHTAQAANEKLGRIVDALAKEYGVNETEFGFNVDTLEFVPLAKE